MKMDGLQKRNTNHIYPLKTRISWIAYLKKLINNENKKKG